MTCYVVTFEPSAGTSVDKIHERLKTFTSYCPIHKYCWAVMSDFTPVQMRDHLAAADSGARIFVVRSGTAAAWRNPYGEKNSEWLKNNL